MPQDRVLTIHDYYDGPRRGVAEFEGRPHIYEAEFDHSADEYGDTYFLTPVESSLLNLILEDWAIWCRWDEARARGEVNMNSHPALPVERQRHEEIQRLIGDQFKTDPSNRKRYRATFFTPPEHRGTWNGTLVHWERDDA
ncbi:MAG: hypothetical protein ACK5JG_13335 [Pseudomonadota bacterium]|jgi:hypothetical protein|nr:hypothetical protein [Rubrivivax sp.]